MLHRITLDVETQNQAGQDSICHPLDGAIGCTVVTQACCNDPAPQRVEHAKAARRPTNRSPKRPINNSGKPACHAICPGKPMLRDPQKGAERLRGHALRNAHLRERALARASTLPPLARLVVKIRAETLRMTRL